MDFGVFSGYFVVLHKKGCKIGERRFKGDLVCVVFLPLGGGEGEKERMGEIMGALPPRACRPPHAVAVGATWL